jgi:hypothetical protein
LQEFEIESFSADNSVPWMAEYQYWALSGSTLAFAGFTPSVTQTAHQLDGARRVAQLLMYVHQPP